jgi:hypothetical protein
MKAKPAPKLADYLRIRKVYNTVWPDIFEVINSAGDGRYPVVLTSPTTGVCRCRRGYYDEPCRHLVLTLMRRGGIDGRGIDYRRDEGGAGRSPFRRAVAA